jgi:hypothetical protein
LDIKKIKIKKSKKELDIYFLKLKKENWIKKRKEKEMDKIPLAEKEWKP